MIYSIAAPFVVARFFHILTESYNRCILYQCKTRVKAIECCPISLNITFGDKTGPTIDCQTATPVKQAFTRLYRKRKRLRRFKSQRRPHLIRPLLLLTDHQQGTHALDHYAVVYRVSNDGLHEMPGISGGVIEWKEGKPWCHISYGFAPPCERWTS